MSKQRHVVHVVITAEVLDADDRRTNKRWGKAVRRALNELVRCYEESERQRRRIGGY